MAMTKNVSDTTSLTTALGTDGTTVTDAATTLLGAIGANNANNAFASNLIAANADGSVLERLEAAQADLTVISAAVLAAERAVAKTDGSVTNPTDALFTVVGGPVLVVEFVGIVTTQIGAGASTCQLQFTTTAPAGTVNFSTAVDLDGDAAGTSYTFTVATPGVLTPTTAGALDQVPQVRWLWPIGSLAAAFSATRTGVIKWYLVYKPLSSTSVVTAAA